MRARFTQYDVPGWGVGELWTGDDVLLAHEFRFEAVAGASGSASGAFESASGAFRSASAAFASADAASRGDKPTRSRAHARARPPLGAFAPLSGTVPSERKRVGNDFVPNGQQAPSTTSRIAPEDLVERFRAFFAGEPVDFADVPIDLEWATPFQRGVAEALRALPRGEVVSYGELAALAGYPGAARAAGSFCARNRLMLVVPCHRVVGAHGIGGYGSAGAGTKRRLLALEGVEL